jgi:hypothetical protein
MDCSPEFKLNVQDQGGREAVPIHDWSRVDENLFHAFQQRWISALCDALNTEDLPEDHFALIERVAQVPAPNIPSLPPSSGRDVPTAQADKDRSIVPQADRVAVRRDDGQLIAAVEIVSQADKASDVTLRAFAGRASKMIVGGIHLLIVDLFPPTENAPHGIHKAIWDELEEVDFELPGDKPLIAASYDSGPLPVSYVEPLAVGDILPEMPLFLRPDSYVPAPLEASYQTAWDLFPAVLKKRLEP